MGYFKANLSNLISGELPGRKAERIPERESIRRARPDRRKFIALATLAAVAVVPMGAYLFRSTRKPLPSHPSWMPYESLYMDDEEIEQAVNHLLTSGRSPFDVVSQNPDPIYLAKVRNFDQSFVDDFYLSESQLKGFARTWQKINAVQQVVGHGNFNVLSFDDLLRWAEKTPAIGPFLEEEKDLLDKVFHEDARRYGFFGEKIDTNLTRRISKRDLAKISGTGQQLYRGDSFDLYQQLRRELGPDLILTSGIRGIPKQMYLFLGKALATGGNLSQASRSIAPPGYSWHGKGDFDVGRRGFGAGNFTSDFIMTPEYRKLASLGYIKPRYPRDNLLGVRFEPWHISVI